MHTCHRISSEHCSPSPLATGYGKCSIGSSERSTELETTPRVHVEPSRLSLRESESPQTEHLGTQPVAIVGSPVCARCGSRGPPRLVVGAVARSQHPHVA